MHKWNKADTLLAGVAILFLVFLLLKLQYPQVLVIQALFFASEAALVGGVADWFAVTALFKKPLGFPYHTALLPRQRERFIQACSKMVQDEFFSKKKILARIKKFNLLPGIIAWIESNHGKLFIKGVLISFVEDFIARLDRKALAEILEREIIMAFRTYRQEDFYRYIAQWCKERHMDDVLFDRILLFTRHKLEQEAAREDIENFLRSYVAEKAKDFLGGLGGILGMLAQVANIINFSEAAEVLQRQLLRFNVDLLEHDNTLRKQLISQAKTSLSALIGTAEWQKLIDNMQQDIANELQLQEELENLLTELFTRLKREKATLEYALVAENPLVSMIDAQVERCFAILNSDTELRGALEQLACELFCRSALEAQAMTGIVVREVLAGMSDDDLNKLVYSKVEQDLLWIRMNGSIVGAMLGLVFFVVLEVIK